MAEDDNRERGMAAAETAVKAYEKRLGEEGARAEDEQIIDLITDLLHFAESKGLDPQKLADQAADHYEDESEESDGDDEGGEEGEEEGEEE